MSAQPRLRIVPVTLREATAYVAIHHRHHRPPRGGILALPEEGGASLRGAGWTCVGAAGGGTWSCPSRPRLDLHPTQEKLRWEMRDD